MFKQKVEDIVQHLKCKCLEKEFEILVEHDKIVSQHHELYTGPRTNNSFEPRTYIQLKYTSECVKTKETEEWKGRKWYLSEYMTEDEIVKTCYAAFQAAVVHEIMEGFTYDDVIVFNPHVNFRELINISHNEVKRS